MFSRCNADVVLVMYSPSQKTAHTQLSSFIVLRVFCSFAHILPHFVAAAAADLIYVTQTVNINHRRHQVYIDKVNCNRIQATSTEHQHQYWYRNKPIPQLYEANGWNKKREQQNNFERGYQKANVRRKRGE